ncbi:MAG: hypothetical protein LH609_01735, partial [Rudanella sp.]|nr:hypothetical protein [Rudanella sp.]
AKAVPPTKQKLSKVSIANILVKIPRVPGSRTSVCSIEIALEEYENSCYKTTTLLHPTTAPVKQPV